MSNSRAIVAKILCSLLNDRGPLNTLLAKHKDHPEFSLIQESCYGCCRWYFALEFVLEQLLNKAVKKQDLDIKCLMICAIVQFNKNNLKAQLRLGLVGMFHWYRSFGGTSETGTSLNGTQMPSCAQTDLCN